MLLAHAVASSIVIAGPTAIGKTSVAVSLAQLLPNQFEIVSADSIQAYRRFDVGSAKPTHEERNSAQFHLIDVVQPDDEFTLVDYQHLAGTALIDIVQRGKTPIVVGGTGLYIRSVINGLGVPVAGPDEVLRTELSTIAEEQGTKVLHDQLDTVDPVSAARIHENDLKRIIRALEVFKLSGRPLSDWHSDDAKREKGKPLKYYALNRDRQMLYNAIDDRAGQMFENGVVEEVASLRADGYSPELKPMTALGYLQANMVLDNKVSRAEAAELTKAATRQYARRQLIWFRGQDGVEWIDVETETPLTIAEHILSSVEFK